MQQALFLHCSDNPIDLFLNLSRRNTLISISVEIVHQQVLFAVFTIFTDLYLYVVLNTYTFVNFASFYTICLEQIGLEVVVLPWYILAEEQPC